MPLYEYSCRDCGHRFEQIVFGKTAPACPSCESRKVSRLLSVFAVSSSQGSRSESDGPAACGSCGDPRGPGSCAID